jgi:hypothetical protein
MFMKWKHNINPEVLVVFCYKENKQEKLYTGHLHGKGVLCCDIVKPLYVEHVGSVGQSERRSEFIVKFNPLSCS